MNSFTEFSNIQNIRHTHSASAHKALEEELSKADFVRRCINDTKSD